MDRWETPCVFFKAAVKNPKEKKNRASRKIIPSINPGSTLGLVALCGANPSKPLDLHGTQLEVEALIAQASERTERGGLNGFHLLSRAR